MNFSMPNYAQKERDYIEDRLVESVDSGKLANAVINELMLRDYSFFDDYVQEAGLKSFYDSGVGKSLFCPQYEANHNKLKEKNSTSVSSNSNTDAPDAMYKEGFFGAGNSEEILDLVISSMENRQTIDKWIGLYSSASKLYGDAS